MTPITFTLTHDDVLAGNRLAIRRTVRKGAPRIALVLLLVAIGVTLIAYASNPQPVSVVAELFVKIVAIYLAVTGFGILYLGLIAPRQRARKNIAQMPAISREQTMAWDDTSITFSSEIGQATIPLRDMHQWAMDETMLLLYPADHLFYFISRRYVADPADWDSLISTLRAAGIKQI